MLHHLRQKRRARPNYFTFKYHLAEEWFKSLRIKKPKFIAPNSFICPDHFPGTATPIFQTLNEKEAAAVKEAERPKSPVEEAERPKSLVEEAERPKSPVETQEPTTGEALSKFSSPSKSPLSLISSGGTSSGGGDLGSDYRPSQESVLGEGLDIKRKVVSYMEQLSLLFRRCQNCGAEIDSKTPTVAKGGRLIINWSCNGGCKGSWSSTPMLGKTSKFCVEFVAAATVSGRTYQDLAHFSDALDLMIPSESGFHKREKRTIYPVIENYWMEQREDILKELRVETGGIRMAADGQFDSPGFSASYCTESVVAVDSGLAVDAVVLRKGDASANSSSSLEPAAFQLALKRMRDEKVKVKTVVTDQQSKITSMMKKEHPNIRHQFDCWHLRKNLKKSLKYLAKLKRGRLIGCWIEPILNHLYYSCWACGGSSEKCQQIWLSLLKHITNDHSDCLHPPLTPEKLASTPWFSKSGEAFKELEKAVNAPYLLSGLASCTDFIHTSVVENLNSIRLRYLPKRKFFKRKGMEIRAYLAMIDHNMGLGRPIATTQTGEMRVGVSFRRGPGKFKASWLKEPKDFAWRRDLIQRAIDHHASKAPSQEIPSTATSGLTAAQKESLVKDLQTRRELLKRKRPEASDTPPSAKRKKKR